MIQIKLRRKFDSCKDVLSFPGFQDSFFLSLIVSLSAVNYARGLGFYSDDWSFLAQLNFWEDQSLIGLIRSFYINLHNMWPRPVQAAYLASLYWLFGFQPTGYHLFNSFVFISGIVVFYWVLRELNQNRWVALTVPMVYGVLPHYSTDRFWYAAFQANLSMTLYFLSLYFDLKMLKAQSSYLWGWKILGLSLNGDVVKPNLKIGNDGVSLSLYDESHYSYKKLFIYDFRRKTISQLKDAETTRQYFAKFNPHYSRKCSKGEAGKGIPIF